MKNLVKVLTIIITGIFLCNIILIRAQNITNNNLHSEGSWHLISDLQVISYYPLNINDKWEYSGPLSKVIKDTVLQNNIKYRMIIVSDSALDKIRYERFSNDKVYRYNTKTQKENLWFDFTRSPGDTINIIQREYDTVTVLLHSILQKSVLGKTRTLYRFVTDNHRSYWRDAVDICDSLGIVAYYITRDNMQRDSAVLSGALINGKSLRTSFPYIYIPFRPGNWWKFSDYPYLISAARDTTMSNYLTYTLIMWGNNTVYFRQDTNFIYRYNILTGIEETELDMSAPEGQIWDLEYIEGDYNYHFFYFSSGFRTDTIFSEPRKIYGYGGNCPEIADVDFAYVYADSIGIIKIFDGFLLSEITEAYVNGQHYSTTSVASEQDEVPTKFRLEQNYPNPFNPTTQIKYSLPESGNISLKVYNLLGKVVSILFEGEQRAGNYSVYLDGFNLSSGVYFYSLVANNFVETKKMVLLK